MFLGTRACGPPASHGLCFLRVRGLLTAFIFFGKVDDAGRPVDGLQYHSPIYRGCRGGPHCEEGPPALRLMTPGLRPFPTVLEVFCGTVAFRFLLTHVDTLTR